MPLAAPHAPHASPAAGAPMLSEVFRKVVSRNRAALGLAAAAARPTHTAAAAAAARRGGDRLVLGIESSCDDTGVAVVTAAGEVLGESLATQEAVHAAWGGVVPPLAQAAHAAAIDGCIAEALAAAGAAPSDLAAVAVTVGPGLALCLRVGALAARRLAAAARVPLIQVHHMEAHALVARLPPQPGAAAAPPQQSSTPVTFPFVCLLVSGGHNLLLVAEGLGRYVQLGATLDDALGEAYDKVARLLGLGAGGGAALEALAAAGDAAAHALPRPMRGRATCDFSYAGLKTAARLAAERALGAPLPPPPGGGGTGAESDAAFQARADLAASFQAAAVDHLADRTARALQWTRASHPGARHLVVAGGVAANAAVRARLAAVAAAAGFELAAPPPRLCTDNGVMVAWAGAERLVAGVGVPAAPPPPAAAGSGGDDGEWIDVRPRWPLTDVRDARAHAAPRSARKARIFEALGRMQAAGGLEAPGADAGAGAEGGRRGAAAEA